MVNSTANEQSINIYTMVPGIYYIYIYILYSLYLGLLLRNHGAFLAGGGGGGYIDQNPGYDRKTVRCIPLPMYISTTVFGSDY